MLANSKMFGMKVWLCFLGALGLAACAVAPVTPPLPPNFDNVPVVPLATSSASVAVALSGPTATPLSPDSMGNAGIIATLAAYQSATGDDPTGSKTAAFTTLDD